MSGKNTFRKILRLLLILFIITALATGVLYVLQAKKSASDGVFPTTASQTTASQMEEPQDVSNANLQTTAEPHVQEGANAGDAAKDALDAEAPLPSEKPEPEPEPEPEPPRPITLMAVGDNLMHMGVVHTGDQPDGTRNYDFLFRQITDFLATADIKIINQETILAGNQLGFSGFPLFNSPTEVGDAIAEAGFNVVLHASNHTADQKAAGIDSCRAFWEEQHPEVLLTGIREKTENDDAERDIPTLTIDGTTFAVLNYTYGPNMEVIPSSIQGRLDMLCAYDKNSGAISFTKLNPQVIEDITAAKELADVVIVCPHWGTEFSTTPSKYQKEFALEMVEAGADLIIGTHPHVTQPVEWIESENGNQALCFYSLGNFVSTQKKPITMLEAMAWVVFDRTEEGVSISREQSGSIPLVCHYTSGPVRIENVYLLENYTAEQAAAHGIRSYGEAPLTLENLKKWEDEILGDSVLSTSDVLGDIDLGDTAQDADSNP